jgi:hypothetical protein
MSCTGGVTGAASAGSRQLVLLEAILAEHTHISDFMREVICELVLRDIEQLLERYMRKMRKSFSRMYWDEDQPLEPGF